MDPLQAVLPKLDRQKSINLGFRETHVVCTTRKAQTKGIQNPRRRGALHLHP